MKQTCPKGEEGQRWKVEETVRAEVESGVSLDVISWSEKAEVPEKTGAETSAGCDASKEQKEGRGGETHTHHALHTAGLTYPPWWRGY